MAHPATFHVAGPEKGMPLIDYIAMRLSISKKRAKQLLDSRVVFVNHQRTWMARHPLERGDIVEVQVPAAAPKSEDADLPILYRDGDYVIIDKPPGLLANGAHSAESRLRTQLTNDDLEAVHRLDRDTSGCLLLAVNAKARDAILPVFEEREMKKIYQALVFGPFPVHLHTIDLPIDGFAARTKVRVLARNKQASHLELRIETGRTHQIRKHLQKEGHPVLGDKVYAIGTVESDRLRNVPRQMLHALELAFTHPLNGASVAAKAPIPADFRKLAQRLNMLPVKG